MKFKERLTAPSSSNKYYIHTSAGGYNKCIKIKGNSCIPNCFSGETKYITDEGLKSFRDTVGTIQQVLNKNGEFVPAEIKNFGKQKLYKITFNNGYSCYCTENHRWVVDRYSYYEDKKYYKRIIKTTLELNSNDNIPYNYFNGNNLMSKEGIVHGIIFGDGSHNSNSPTYRVQLFGDKKELSKYITYPIKSEYDLKKVPPIYESEEYLRGFVAGLFATDGMVSNKEISISNVHKDYLEKIRDICYKIGIHVGKISEKTRDIELGKYTYLNHKLYLLSFKRKNIEYLLLKSTDKEAFKKDAKDIKYTRVASIKKTNRFEDVYCAVEPQTHTITLETNILTGQCVGYSYGRFMECQGLTSCKLPTCNAESWIRRNAAYKTGMTPRLGAVAVYAKGVVGNSSDGAGHVCSVEHIYSDGSILTSNSAYGSTRFYTKRIPKGYALKGYKFLGFIYPDTNFEENWTAGKYKLLNAKAIRGTHDLSNNILKVSQIGLIYRWKLTSRNSKDNAFYKAGTTINVKSIYKDSEGRIWGQLNGAWIVLCNKDGSKQAIKTN